MDEKIKEKANEVRLALLAETAALALGGIGSYACGELKETKTE